MAVLPLKGRKKSMDFGWDWGLRVGIGYNFDKDGWDPLFSVHMVGSRWLRFYKCRIEQFSCSYERVQHSDDCYSASGVTSGQFFYCTSAKSMYDLDYQSIDLELFSSRLLYQRNGFTPSFLGIKERLDRSRPRNPLSWRQCLE